MSIAATLTLLGFDAADCHDCANFSVTISGRRYSVDVTASRTTVYRCDTPGTQDGAEVCRVRGAPLDAVPAALFLAA